MKEPLSNTTAKKLVAAILARGVLTFSKHAYEEMAKDRLDEADVRNVLRGGTCRRCELETGTWRYRFETQQLAVVTAFRSETHAVVITVFRLKKF